MITNFEAITAPLTKRQMEQLPKVISLLSQLKEPVKSPELCRMLTQFTGTKIHGATLRKYTNFIRSKRILPVIATSKGYYLSTDKAVILSQIESMCNRRAALTSAIDGLRKFLSP